MQPEGGPEPPPAWHRARGRGWKPRCVGSGPAAPRSRQHLSHQANVSRPTTRAMVPPEEATWQPPAARRPPDYVEWQHRHPKEGSKRAPGPPEPYSSNPSSRRAGTEGHAGPYARGAPVPWLGRCRAHAQAMERPTHRDSTYQHRVSKSTCAVTRPNAHRKPKSHAKSSLT